MRGGARAAGRGDDAAQCEAGFGTEVRDRGWAAVVGVVGEEGVAWGEEEKKGLWRGGIVGRS